MTGRLPLTILVLLGAATWGLYLNAKGVPLDSSFFAPLSMTVTVVAFATFSFNHWLWRWSCLAGLSHRPNLIGTWKGTIHSQWVDPATGRKPDPIEAYLVVTQTFRDLTLSLFTAESQSISLAATLCREADERSSVSALYRNEPMLSLRDRSAIHYGGLLLRIQGPPPTSMGGSYFTDRHSDGDITVNLVSRKRAHDFATAQSLAG